MTDRPWILDLAIAFSMGLIGYLVLSQFLVSHQKDLVQLQREQELLQESIVIRRSVDCREPCATRWAQKFPGFTFQCAENGLRVAKVGLEDSPILLCPQVLPVRNAALTRVQTCRSTEKLLSLDFSAQKVNCVTLSH
jgi:hypothetical protein